MRKRHRTPEEETNMITQKLFRWAVAAMLLACAGAGAAAAETYPNKPVTLILPLGAGGSHDLNARVFTSVIPQYLNQAMIVKLMPGASGQKGTAAAAEARPDGYTLLFTHNYFDQLQQHVTKLPYDTNKDFETVARLNYGVASIVVLASSPYKTLKDMIDYGKKNPGKLKFGHSGNWGAVMVPGAQLLQEAGVRATLVPHQGGGPSMKALLTGDVDFTMAFSSVITAQGDKLRVLASGGDEREFKDAPMLKELGYASDIGVMDRIVLAPKGVPPERMKVLRGAFAALQKDKTYVQLIKRIDENTSFMDGPEYEKQRLVLSDKYKKLVSEITK
jgi:tripartite-type tricarboxylate transporter receptor subunit TctC